MVPVARDQRGLPVDEDRVIPVFLDLREEVLGPLNRAVLGVEASVDVDENPIGTGAAEQVLLQSPKHLIEILVEGHLVQDRVAPERFAARVQGPAVAREHHHVLPWSFDARAACDQKEAGQQRRTGPRPWNRSLGCHELPLQRDWLLRYPSRAFRLKPNVRPPRRPPAASRQPYLNSPSAWSLR